MGYGVVRYVVVRYGVVSGMVWYGSKERTGEMAEHHNLSNSLIPFSFTSLILFSFSLFEAPASLCTPHIRQGLFSFFFYFFLKGWGVDSKFTFLRFYLSKITGFKMGLFHANKVFYWFRGLKKCFWYLCQNIVIVKVLTFFSSWCDAHHPFKIYIFLI